jgi:hypothetical protein
MVIVMGTRSGKARVSDRVGIAVESSLKRRRPTSSWYERLLRECFIKVKLSFKV